MSTYAQHRMRTMFCPRASQISNARGQELVDKCYALTQQVDTARIREDELSRHAASLSRELDNVKDELAAQCAKPPLAAQTPASQNEVVRLEKELAAANMANSLLKEHMQFLQSVVRAMPTSQQMHKQSANGPTTGSGRASVSSRDTVDDVNADDYKQFWNAPIGTPETFAPPTVP